MTTTVGNERGFFIKRMDSSSNGDRFSFCGIYGERWTWEREKNWQRKRYKRNRRGGWATQNIPYFSVNIRSRNKVDIEIRATDGGSQASSPLTQQPHLQFAVRDHRYQPTAVHTHVYPHHGAPTSTRTSRRIDVSTCLPITDCNGIVDREGGRSFSFGRPSYFSFPHMFASFASCNIVPHSSFYTHRSTIPFFIFLYRYQSHCLPLPLFLFLFRQSMVLRPKGKSINSPGEIVTRNMEYWVRAKLPLVAA